MFYIIYKITNTKNNKMYIGITSESLQHRFNGHVRKANIGSTSNFHKAIRKYGKESFLKEILYFFESEDKKYAYSVEQDYINKYNSVKLGYNMDKFGWNISDKRGKNNPMYGKISGNAKKVSIDGTIYISCTEAGKILGKSPKTISSWVLNKKDKYKDCFYIDK